MRLLLPLTANFSSASAEGGFLGTVGAEADGVKIILIQRSVGLKPERLLCYCSHIFYTLSYFVVGYDI